MLFFRFRRTTPVAKLTVGQPAIVEGKVVAKTWVTLPYAEQKGVFYALTQSTFRLSERGGRRLWLVESFDQQQSGFWVEDGTGRLYVPIQPRHFNVRGGVMLQGDVSPTRRWSAQLIKEGDRIRVYGTPDKPSGKEPKENLALRPSPEQAIQVLIH